MGSREQANTRRWMGGAIAPLVLAATAFALTPAQAAGQGQGQVAAAEVAQPRSARHQPRGLEDRVKVMARALDLDARQQLELRKILQGQRQQVMKAWSDTTVAPAYRVAATQAIGDGTADQIRALLNDEQKKRYSAPRQAREAASSGPSVEDWMKKG
jgi:hypothetical protein